MFPLTTDKQSIDNLVKRRAQLQRQLISGRKYIDPSDDPTIFAELQQYYSQMKAIRKTLENIKDALHILNLTESGLELLKQINRSTTTLLTRVSENVLDEQGFYNNMRLVNSYEEEFFNTVATFKHRNLCIFDTTGDSAVLEWDLSTNLGGQMVYWIRPKIIKRPTNNAVLNTDMKYIYFFRTADMSKYYLKFEDAELVSSSGMFASKDKDILNDDVIKNIAVLDEDYYKLIENVRDAGITIQKIKIRREILLKTLANLENTTNSINAIDVDQVKYEINAIDEQLKIARTAYTTV